jgi:hypothetical protein
MSKQNAPRCTGTTKTGQPCKASPLKGTDRCLAHSDADTRASVGFTPDAGARGGRPRLPKPSELARQLVERNVCAILRPHFKALGLQLNDDGCVEPLDRGAILTGESKDGTVVASTIEDLGAQIAAAEKLLDRVYGRPKQQTEISGPEGGPINLQAPDDATDRSTRAAMLLARAGQLPEAALSGSNGNGSNGNGSNGNGRH